eukprot:s290_g31.t1
MERVEEENNDLRIRMGEVATHTHGQFNLLENATQHEMQAMAQQLSILNAELMAARQEDEGATYRIEELERYKLMSDEVSARLQQKYIDLWSEFSAQMEHTTSIVAHTGYGLKDQVQRSRIELENARITAEQEAMAVGFANNQSCALRFDMLEAVNQNNTMRSTMARSIRHLETELDAAGMKRDEITREFRADLRHEHDRLAECEHQLALEESRCHIQSVRSESLQMQLTPAENRHSETASPSASPLRGISGRELHELQDEVSDYQEQKILDDRAYHELLSEYRDDRSLLEANQAGLTERNVNEALNVSADRMMRQGKNDRQIKDELSVGQQHVDEHEAEAALFKNEYRVLLNEFKEEKMKAESSIALNTQHNEIAAAKALYQSEMNQAKFEKEKEVKKLREDLQYAER